MRFNELAQNAKDDESNKWELDDTRRPKLTLRHLNKMRNRRILSTKILNTDEFNQLNLSGHQVEQWDFIKTEEKK